MWRAATFVVLAAGTSAARADETPRVEARSSLTEHGPVLELDPTLATNVEGLGAIEDSERTAIRIDPRTVLTLEGTWWSNDDRDRDGRPALDVAGRGWRAGVRLSRDVGFATLEVGGVYNETELEHLTVNERNEIGAFGRARYVDVGAAVTRRFGLSPWMHAWISLGINRRIWVGDSPTGEPDATSLGLSIGTTFR